MPREARKCSVTGDVYVDARAHGYGCPHHTDLGKCTQTQLLSYYPDRRSEFPYGRYCCSFCRVHQKVITVSGSSGGGSAYSASSTSSSTTKEKPGCVATCGTIAMIGFLILLCSGLMRGCS